jgi:hypothetical protein
MEINAQAAGLKQFVILCAGPSGRDYGVVTGFLNRPCLFLCCFSLSGWLDFQAEILKKVGF